MHPAALANFQREFNAVLSVSDWRMSTRLRVLDMGGQDVNGTVHGHLRAWLAERLETLHVLDIEAGPGVTHVGDARKLDWWDGHHYDVVISTEMLEHLEGWYSAIDVARAVLRSGGWFIGTCAGYGRAPHGATGAPSPLSGEWYENISAESLTIELTSNFDRINVGYEMNGASTTHDLHWRARKAS